MRKYFKYVMTQSLLRTAFKKFFYLIQMGTWKHDTSLLLQGGMCSCSFYLIATYYLLFASEAMVCCGQKHAKVQKPICLRN